MLHIAYILYNNFQCVESWLARGGSTEWRCQEKIHDLGDWPASHTFNNSRKGTHSLAHQRVLTTRCSNASETKFIIILVTGGRKVSVQRKSIIYWPDLGPESMLGNDGIF